MGLLPTNIKEAKRASSININAVDDDQERYAKGEPFNNHRNETERKSHEEDFILIDIEDETKEGKGNRTSFAQPTHQTRTRQALRPTGKTGKYPPNQLHYVVGLDGMSFPAHGYPHGDNDPVYNLSSPF